jgi:tripartite ATP-independent transporter DctM subunit
MTMAFAALLIVLVAGFLTRVPLGHAMIVAGIFYLILSDRDLGNASQLVMGGLYSKFILLAVPMFIFSAQIMNNSTVTDRVFDLAHALVGKLRGGLAQVDVVASVIFSGMSGSAIADASGPGLLITRSQIRGGYPPGFACAATCASATIGPIIPPSIPMVIYGYIASTSVGMLFAAGLIPGLLIAALQMVLIGFIARRRGFPAPGWMGFMTLITSFIKALPALMTVVILLGGIYSGIFTPTEAAAVAALWALLLAFLVYRSMGPKDFWRVFRVTLRQTSAISMVLAGALLISYAVAAEGVGRRLADAILSLTDNGTLLLVLVMLIFLVLGMFLDTIVLLLVMVPIVLPAMNAAGVDPVHLGVVITLNMMIGLSTPPMGVLLLLMSNLTSTPLGEIIREMWPFLLNLIFALMVLIFFPAISLWLPGLLGYSG